MNGAAAASSEPSPVPPTWSPLLIIAFAVAYTPMLYRLPHGEWETDQRLQSLVIVAAFVWAAWRLRGRCIANPTLLTDVVGWIALCMGLVLMIMSRTQRVMSADAASLIAVAGGCILIIGGLASLRAMVLPLVLLMFMVPVPDWLLDTVTVPLKVFISDTVTEVLYRAGYPIAQDGVIIVIAPYELFVKDACSGLNSIFALSAVGLFYTFYLRREYGIRRWVVLLAIVPIAMLANFLRVLATVVMVHHGLIDYIEGPLHTLTGIFLFLFAILCVATLDQIMAFAGKFRRRLGPSPTMTVALRG